MKQFSTITFMLVCSIFFNVAFAQKQEGKSIKYRRSSLHTVLIESESFPNKDIVTEAYFKAPFPEKYNDHRLDENAFDPSDYQKRVLEAGVAENKSEKKGDPDFTSVINQYIKEKKIANQMVAKWFNRTEDGAFDMQLIGDRGMYNATEMEATIAKSSARGESSLADAGEELIGNTFVVFNKLKFVENEKVAAAIRDAAYAASSSSIVRALADVAYQAGKKGYSVWTSAYLYKLKWNDSISNEFYMNHWTDKSNLDAEKVAAFENSDLFELEFIGKEKARSLVTLSLKKKDKKRTEAQILELATVRNVNQVFVKLQKKYDVFKPKVPLLSGNPATAKIGMKEGLKGGEKFEVLEQIMDPETGRTKYVRRGKIKVDKKQIWDNRYNLSDETEEEDPLKPQRDRTTFSGGSKKFYSGMLLRQLK